MGDYQPHLVRTSSLDPDFIRNNLSLVNIPVKLLFEKDTMEMTKNWTEEEINNQRRLVKFEFVRISPSDYLVKFRPIPRSEFTNDAAIISCIFWKEKELHIVTSVDIILLLEYLIQQSFSIEEKNRVRRNLQSLKPLTITRSNSNYQRFFQLLMSMEDPRPRNIEKDLKVFKWTDLFSALNKVISKYSSRSIPVNNEDATPIEVKPERAVNFPSNIAIPSLNQIPPSIAQKELASESERESFLPFERIKVMRKKSNSGTSNPNLYLSNLQNKYKAYQDGIAPSDPVLIKQEPKGAPPMSSFLNPIPQGKPMPDHSDAKEKLTNDLVDIEMEPSRRASKMEVESGSTSGTDETGDTTSSGGVTSSDDQDEDKSRSNSGSKVPKSDLNYLGEDDNMITSSGEGSKSDSSSVMVMSGSVNGSGSNSKGNSSGGSGSRNSELFSNIQSKKGKISSQNTGFTSVDNISSKGANTQNISGNPRSESFSKINQFAQDQSDRLFGASNKQDKIPGTDQPYYMYPDASQIHYMNNPSIVNNTSIASATHPTKNLAPIKNLGSDVSQASKNISLPSLEEYFTTNRNNETNLSVKLPPIINKSNKDSLN